MKQEDVIYDKTEKGKEAIKITNAIDRFKKKYPKKSSQCLEFVGIYDDKAVMRILKKILKGSKFEGVLKNGRGKRH